MSRERRSDTLTEGQSSSTPNTSRAQNSAQEFVGNQYSLGVWSMFTSLQASVLASRIYCNALQLTHSLRGKELLFPPKNSSLQLKIGNMENMKFQKKLLSS